MRKPFYAIIVLSLLSATSCSDLLKIAADKGNPPAPLVIATDFSVQQGNDNRENLVTWTNPLSGDFSGVRLLRRTDALPEGFDDPGATIVYEGAGIRYRDSLLDPGSTYYYGLFAKAGTTYSEAGVFGSRLVTETALDIRKRSFFLIGGSNSYPDPTTSFVTGVDMYDPLTQQLTADVTTLPTARVFCAVASANGKIYVFGGKNSGGVSTIIDILDIATMSWTTGTVWPQARCALVAVPYNGRIYCLGGSTGTTTAGASAQNYIYDIAGDSWTTNTSICADLSSARCAFTGVAFRSMLYYYSGVLTGGGLAGNGEYRNLLTNQSIALGGLLNNYGCTPAFYHKDFSDGSEVAIFLTMGGSPTVTGPTLLPVTTITLTGNYQVYAAFMPNPTGGAPAGYRVMPTGAGGTGIEAFTNRAYAGCEYYGDYLYLFGGLAGGGPTASTLIERLDVKNGDLFNGEWTSAGIGVLQTQRYGFGITRVND